MPTYKILFVGLGKMGFHMAGYLSKNKNIKLSVFNRTKSVEIKWKKKFIAESYNFKNDIKFDFIISCLKDDHAVNAFFNKFVKTLNFHKNSIIIDHSTISLRQIDLLPRIFKQRKVKFLDAPITGGEEGAKKIQYYQHYYCYYYLNNKYYQHLSLFFRFCRRNYYPLM